MQEIVTVLTRAFPEKNMRLLDLFCGDGSSLSRHYIHLCGRVIGVDHDRRSLLEYSQIALERDGGHTHCFGEDAISFLQDIGSAMNPVAWEEFDLISVDNPQGMYGEGQYENFDFLYLLPDYVSEGGYLLFHVNRQPFKPVPRDERAGTAIKTQVEFSQWMQRRREFYGLDAEILDREWLIEFYQGWFAERGHAFSHVSSHLRKSALEGHPDHIEYLLFKKDAA